MRIHEITQPVTEGVASFLARNQNIIPFGSWLTGARWGGELDPITGKMVPNKQWQAHLDALSQEHRAALTKQKVGNFNAWLANEIKKSGGTAEPSATDFNNLLDQWTNQYLKLSAEKTQYDPSEMAEITKALDQVKNAYNAAPSGKKLQQIQRPLNELVMTWLQQSQTMLNRRDEKSIADPFSQFGAQLKNVWRAYFPKLNRNGSSTGNTDVDNFLRGMGFNIDASTMGTASAADATRQAAIKTAFAKEKFDPTYIYNMFGRLGVPATVFGTGNENIDDFFRIVGVPIK